MQFTSFSRALALLSVTWLWLSTTVSAENMLFTRSLNTCPGYKNEGLTAQLFDVTYFASNNTAYLNIRAISSINEKVILQMEVIAYGLVAINQTFDPCNDQALGALCPLQPAPFQLDSTRKDLGSDVAENVPSIAFGVPDLDGTVRAYINRRTDGKTLACVEAELSNGKTVNQLGVKWATAIISGLALIISGVVSGLGHSNTAAHVASNALSLFGFFQSQALIGMTAVHMPPIVQSWTQNFMWSMGLVRIGFIQDMAIWYQRATGGTPTTLLSNINNVSVQVQKRSMEVMKRMVSGGVTEVAKRGLEFMKRQADENDTEAEMVEGIKRAGFRANIEPTNIFLTGLAIFVSFLIIVVACVALFKGFCELAAKRGWIKGDKFSDFRNGWQVVLKGILFRIVLIGYTQMSVLCMWELTQRDSVAEVIIAVFYWLAMTAALGFAAVKVVLIAKRSVSLHKNPAYILYSDPTALNKWGFLYVQYRATAYYYIIPQLLYLLVKALIVAFGQGSGIAQAVGLLIVEAGWLIGVSIIRPWMDKKTNGINISIAAIGFLSTVFLLILTDVFNQPGIVSGVIGVVFFVVNAVFALVLLIMVIVSSSFAVFSKNPDLRYQPMRDDRGSFIKSQSNLNTELDALGAAARGEKGMKRDLDDDTDSFSSGPNSMVKNQADASGVPPPASTNASSRNVNEYGNPPHSPVDPSQPFIPNNGAPRHQPPQMAQMSPSRSMNNQSPAPRYPGVGAYGYDRSGSMNSNTSYRPYGGGSQWQRGAGYDH